MMTSLEGPQVRRALERFLAEDVGRGDLTTRATVDPAQTGVARVEARSPFVVAGLDAARMCFELASGGRIAWDAATADGDHVEPGAIVTVTGPLGPVLTAERTALNLLARMSAVATHTARFVRAVAGTPARIVDTRKTTPGLRLFEKYAVRAGGGSNHRFGLDDGILVKDNHIAATGSVAEAVRRAKAAAPHGLLVEVEVSDLDELDEALAAGADALLLDNMSPDQVRDAVTRAGGKAVLEASGGMTLDNVRDYALAGVDLISVGVLTHSPPAVDVALEVIPDGDR